MKDIEKLKKAYEEIIWMAIRYADGRQTYAPSMVRDSVKAFKEVFPEWEPRPDPTIGKSTFHGTGALPSDSLIDLFPAATSLQEQAQMWEDVAARNGGDF